MSYKTDGEINWFEGLNNPDDRDWTSQPDALYRLLDLLEITKPL
jgi:hypothetical protein